MTFAHVCSACVTLFTGFLAGQLVVRNVTRTIEKRAEIASVSLGYRLPFVEN